MKQIVLVFTLSLFSLSNSFSQVVPNSGSEMWDTFPAPPQPPVYYEPIGWTSWNSQYPSYPLTVSPSTDTCLGIYSAQIQNMQYTNQISGLPDTLQGVLLSGADLVSGALGFQVLVRVTSMQVCYKYTRAGNDSAEFSIRLSKYNSLSGQTQIISCNQGICYKRIGTSTTSFSSITIPISYINGTVVPDTAIISFSPSASNSQASVTPGSTLWIDEVVLNTGVSTPDIEKDNSAVHVFPNPSRDEVSFSSLPKDAAGIRLMDITGKTVEQYSVSASHMVLSVKNLTVGMYIYEVSDVKKKTLAVGKISVIE